MIGSRLRTTRAAPRPPAPMIVRAASTAITTWNGDPSALSRWSPRPDRDSPMSAVVGFVSGLVRRAPSPGGTPMGEYPPAGSPADDFADEARDREFVPSCGATTDACSKLAPSVPGARPRLGDEAVPSLGLALPSAGTVERAAGNVAFCSVSAASAGEPTAFGSDPGAPDEAGDSATGAGAGPGAASGGGGADTGGEAAGGVGVGAGIGTGAGAGAGTGAGGAAGAGGGVGAARGGRSESGSTYVSASPTRIPRWT